MYYIGLAIFSFIASLIYYGLEKIQYGEKIKPKKIFIASFGVFLLFFLKEFLESYFGINK